MSVSRLHPPATTPTTAAGTRRTGRRRLLEQLRADGVRYLFGDPGAGEEWLPAEIAGFPDIDYVLGLQEAAVVCTADGYARATGRPSVVLLHGGAGLGNAVGGLGHALHRRTPMLVLTAEPGGTYDDLVDMARPVTKHADRVTRPENLLPLVRRALKVAATPPRGPVFLAVPTDVLDQVADEAVMPTSVPDTRVVPEPAAIQAAARLLATAHAPVVLAGDGVAASGAVGELTRFAETWGAVVHGVMASELLMPWNHPLWGGPAEHGTDLTTHADAVLIVGARMLPEVADSTLRPGGTVVQVDLDPDAMAENHPVTAGMLGDPRLTLRALTAAFGEAMTEPQRQAAAERVRRRGALRAAELDKVLTDDLGAGLEADSAPLRMPAVAAALAGLLPDDAIVVDEALTSSPALNRWLPPTRPGHFFQNPGGTLGVGIPGAIGARIAHPERTVVGFTSDGGAMHTCQALWTAAHHGVAAKFVVCHHVYEPRVDYVHLAAAMGVPASRVRHAADLSGVLRTMLDHDGPYLVEAVLDEPGAGSTDR
ncbi:thiamine pyrophosphate-binding protein [Actinoplanes sichuanensis]|uniref:Thiamine pyrophosphate-binding protein n=1 Tax=Actinoplanes sichuanensis TaxID=512349 RepID=A0ABW4ASA1_9ACTN|nr:thiamine pyrophosphate-binding protein [Actinoplanes sichuanensis]BEL07328.1 thiamine pyrophosphate-binding protein [Actinoplanes sichuanensis]